MKVWGASEVFKAFLMRSSVGLIGKMGRELLFEKGWNVKGGVSKDCFK